MLVAIRLMAGRGFIGVCLWFLFLFFGEWGGKGWGCGLSWLVFVCLFAGAGFEEKKINRKQKDKKRSEWING